MRATELDFNAAVNQAMRKEDELTAALLVSNAAPYASDWKQALPNSRDTTYCDAWFPNSVRYTLGIAEPGLPALVLSITMQMEVATCKTFLMLCLVADIRSKASHSDMMGQCRY